MLTKSKNNIIGLKELRLNTKKYISHVSKGESFIIVRRSKPIFKLVPFDEDDDSIWETVVDFTTIRKGGVPAELVLESIKRLNEQDSKNSR